jgi:cyanate permease
MLVQALLYFLFAAILFVVSVFVQSVSGFDSFQTALTTLPISAGVALFSFFTPGLGKRIAPKWIIIFGFLLVLLGTYLLGNEVAVDMTPMSSLLGSIVVGVGCGLVMGQIATVTMMKVPAEQNGEASGLSETLKEIIGQGFAIAFSGAVLFGSVYSSMTHEYEQMESIDLSEEEEQVIMIELEDTFQAITPAEEQDFIQTLPEKTQTVYQDIVNRSAKNAFVRTMYVLNIFVVLCIVMSFFLPNSRITEE